MVNTQHQELARLARSILDDASEMSAEWEWLAKRIMPRNRDALLRLSTPIADWKREHCETACEALLMLVGAFMSHVTPSGQRWFEFESRNKTAGKYEAWYRNATEVVLQSLAASNFYSAVQETHLDRCLYGTGCMLCEVDKLGELRFTHIPVGTFGLSENTQGNVDTVCRTFSYTARQAVDAWGYDAMPGTIQSAWDDIERRYKEKFEFMHLVTPRKSFTRGNGKPDGDPLRMKYASIYFYNGGGYPIVAESGYPEFPYLASRFLRWGESVWGYPPARKCRDEIEGVIRTERLLDRLGELAAFPRLFIDAEQDGDVDFRAGGTTVIDRTIAGMNLPREWGSQGRYDIGLDRLQRGEDKIRSAFFIPFLQVVSQIDRQMTATEVIARQQEQVLAISPTFAQFVADFNTMLARVFAVLYRSGRMETSKGAKPPDVQRPTADGEDFDIEVPSVAYLGKIAQSVLLTQKQSLDYAIQSVAQYVQMTGDTSALDYVDMGSATKFTFKSMGAPSEVFRSDDEVAQIRAQREQAALAQAALVSAQGQNQAAQAAATIQS